MFGLLQWADIITTTYALKHTLAHEANGIVYHLISSYGLQVLWYIKLGAIAFTTLGLWVCSKLYSTKTYDKLKWWIIGADVVLMAVVVANNLWRIYA